MKEKIEKIVIEAIKDLNEEIESEDLKNISIDTKLYGRGPLDSLSLVRLIVDLEKRIYEEFGISILLTDEKALSYRTSPFRTVGTLISYIVDLLTKGNQ